MSLSTTTTLDRLHPMGQQVRQEPSINRATCAHNSCLYVIYLGLCPPGTGGGEYQWTNRSAEELHSAMPLVLTNRTCPAYSIGRYQRAGNVRDSFRSTPIHVG